MIWQLMKLDPAWIWLPVVLLAGAVICAFGGNFAFWNMLLIAGVIAADRIPDVPFYAGLPVSVRAVLVERTLSLLALLWLPLAFAEFLLPAGAETLITFGSVITLAVMWIQITRIMGRTGQPWLAVAPFAIWIVYSIMRTQFPRAFAGWGAWLSNGVAPVAGAVAATCWMLTIALFLRGFFHAPLSFSVGSGGPRSSAAGDAIRMERQARTSAGKACRRIALSFGYLWILFFVLAFMVGLRLSDSGPIACVFLITVWRSVRPNVSWMSFLPVASGALPAVIFLPALIAVAGGYVLGVHLPVGRLPWLNPRDGAGIILRASQELPTANDFKDTPGCPRLNVVPPAEFWLPVVGGKPPLIQAPWGEQFQPSGQRLDGVEVYNPWSVGCGNSEHFLDWQLSRASSVVYGKQVARDQLADTHTVLSALAVPGLRAQIFSISALAVALMCFTIVSMAEDWWRIRTIEGGIFFRFLAIVPCAILFVGQNFLARWASWVFPASLPVATTLAMLPVLLICWAFAGMFRQLEFVDKPAAGVSP